MDGMNARVRRLEREVRVGRILLLLVGVLLVAWAGLGATDGIPEVVRARKFLVVNDQGTPVVEIGTTESGGGLLSVNSAAGEIRLHLAGATPANTGGTLRIANVAGQFVIVLRPDRVGNGLVGAYDRDGVGSELKPWP